MKQTIKFSLLFLIMISSFASFSQKQTKKRPPLEKGTITLTVVVEGITKQEGTLLINIFNTAENFPRRKGTIKRASVGVDTTTITQTFKNLPEGDYAIMTMHDVNSDKKMNKNAIGFPDEPYGFSNNIKPTFSIPSFDEAKFTLKGDQKITIELIN